MKTGHGSIAFSCSDNLGVNCCVHESRHVVQHVLWP